MAFVNGGLIAASQRGTPAALKQRASCPATPAPAAAPAPVVASSSRPKFEAKEVARKTFTAVAVALLSASPAFAAVIPNNVPGISDPVLRKEEKYLEEIKRGYDSIARIEDHIAAGRWGKVEDEARELNGIAKPLNIMSADVFRARERQAEAAIKSFVADIRALETTEDKEKAVIDAENARRDIEKFFSLAGIEFQREDAYEKFVEGKTPLLKGDKAF
eukprot:tig00020848_g14540.t1